MQELIQEERQITFEDICPEQSKIISENGGYMATKDKVFVAEDGSIKSIQDCASCVVGEAHGN